MKRSYTRPELEVLGSIAAVTAGNSSGDFTDQTFPNKTPVSDLTFS